MNDYVEAFQDGAVARRALMGPELETRIRETLAGPPLCVDTLVDCCDALAQSLGEEHLALLMARGATREMGLAELSMAREVLSGPYLRSRLARELGEDLPFTSRRFCPHGQGRQVEERVLPLGVLAHVTAGNMVALPAFSALEGLLTGNISLVKLPAEDDGLSQYLLGWLVERLPVLDRYLYLFDFPSTDQQAMERLMALSDTVVVWGGDGAVDGVRRLCPPGVPLVEWGHRLGFAYLTPAGAEEGALCALAKGILDSDQRSCSSCQGIFFDAEGMEETQALAQRFFQVLGEQAVARYGAAALEERAGRVLRHRALVLETALDGGMGLHGAYHSVILFPQARLRGLGGLGTCWVSPLPRRRLLEVLRPDKGWLQSVALLCAAEEREELERLLLAAGATRICRGGDPSWSYCGAPHDGRSPLGRYLKKVSIWT